MSIHTKVFYLICSSIWIFPVLFFLLPTPAAQAQITDSTRFYQKEIRRDLTANKRIYYLNKIAACYWYVDADSALWYARQGSRLLDNSVEPLVRGYNYFVTGVALQMKGNNDSSTFYLKEAYQVFSDNHLDKQKFRALEQLSENYCAEGQPDSAIAIVSKALDWFRNNNNSYYVASSLNKLGRFYIDQNKNQLALACVIESDSIFKLLNDTNMMATCQQITGNIYINLYYLFNSVQSSKAGEYLTHSIPYFTRSLELNELHKNYVKACYAKASLAMTMALIKKTATADSILLTCKDCFNQPNQHLQLVLLNLQSQIATEKKQYATVRDLLTRVVADTVLQVDGNLTMEAKLALAILDMENGNIAPAIKLGKDVYRTARSAGYLITEYESALFLSNLCQKTGLADSALRYLQLAGVLKDSLFMRAGIENVDEMEIRYKSSILNQEVTFLQKEKELNRQKSLLIYAGSVAVFIIFLILTVMLWLRQKRLRLQNLHSLTLKELAEKEIRLKETEMETMKLEQLLKDSKIQRLDTDLKLNQQELVFQALHQEATNNLLTSLITELKPFAIQFTRKKDQDEFNQLIQRLSHNVKSTPVADFERIFSELNPGFYMNVSKDFPDLGQNDLLLCAMIRLNLSSKEIADIANISFTSVDKGRSRLRRKMNLSPGANLTSFLMKF